MSGAGKDSDYAGGEFRREVDKTLQSWGVSRDSPAMRVAHAVEHYGRSVAADLDGDHSRAEAERERARSNFSEDFRKYY